MITSDKQYNAAKQQLELLNQSLSLIKKNEVPAVIVTANTLQLAELIAEIKAELNEYEALKNYNIADIEIHSLDDLMTTPIRYRLAAQMSIDMFGQKVGVSPRQIARYEKECYQNTTTSTLRKILAKLDVHIDGKIIQDKNNSAGNQFCELQPGF